MLAGEKKCRPKTFLRAPCLCRDLVHVQGRGVGCNDGAGLGDRVELGEDLLLQRHVLEHRLDDEVGLAEVLDLQGRGQLGEAVARLRLGDAPALGVGLQRLLDAGDALVERLLRGLDDGDGEAAVEEGEADAGAHGAGAEDAHRPDVAQLGVGADARHVGRLAFGEEGVLQRARIGTARGLGERLALLRRALGERQGGRLDGIDGGLGGNRPARMPADGGARVLEQACRDRRLVDLFLADAPRRLADLPFRKGNCRRHHVALCNLVDQAQRCALGGVDEGAGDDELQRLLDADGARQPLRAAGPRQDAELDLGQPELAHVLARHPVMAPQRQLQATAQRGAVDGGDDRLLARLDLVDQGRQERLLHARAELGDVGARGKEAPCSRQNDRLDAGIGVGLVEGLLQPHAQRVTQRVHRGVVHANDRHLALLLGSHDGHGALSFSDRVFWSGLESIVHRACLAHGCGRG